MGLLDSAPLLISTGALVMSVATFIRSGRWRDTEEARVIDERMTRVERTVDSHSAKLEHLPTKADIARLESDVRALERALGKVDSGVERIESFLLERKS